MSRIARYVKMTARPGQGDALATLMIAVVASPPQRTDLQPLGGVGPRG